MAEPTVKSIQPAPEDASNDRSSASVKLQHVLDHGLGDHREMKALSPFQLMLKDVFDRIAASVLIVLSLPVLLAIGLAIVTDARGPVFFVQQRTGFSGRSFGILKFRTTQHDMKQSERNNPPVTRVGRVLRKTRLDELPQLINVLCGDMSLVGPRPHVPESRVGGRLFRDVAPHYDDRHQVKPGITGWAQVNGWRGETLTERDLTERVRYDLDYIDKWSFMFDLKIIVLTLVCSLHSVAAP